MGQAVRHWQGGGGRTCMIESRHSGHRHWTKPKHLPALYRVNHFCRPVASSENVTEILRLLIVDNRFDVPSVSLIHFILLGRSIHQLLRHDDAPLSDSALKRSELTPVVAVGITGHQPTKQLSSLQVRLLLKPVQYLTPHALEGVRSCVLPATCSFLRRVRGTNLSLSP